MITRISREIAIQIYIINAFPAAMGRRAAILLLHRDKIYDQAALHASMEYSHNFCLSLL